MSEENIENNSNFDNNSNNSKIDNDFNTEIDNEENSRNSLTSGVSSDYNKNNNISSKISSEGSRPLTSKTDDSKKYSTSNNLNDSLSFGNVATFGKLYKPHSPKDESDINDLNEITKLFNVNSLANLSKGGSENIKNSNEKIDEEENVENIVRDLSGFLNKKNMNINNEPVKTINDIIGEASENDSQNSELIIEKVKSEYNRLSKLLVKTRMNETALYNKCTDLSRFLNSCIIKIQGVLNVSRNDRINIVNLNLELEKAWKIIEEKNDSESLLRETIDLLKKEIVKYRKRVKGKLDDLPDDLIDESDIPDVEDENADYVKGLEDVNI